MKKLTIYHEHNAMTDLPEIQVLNSKREILQTVDANDFDAFKAAGLNPFKYADILVYTFHLHSTRTGGALLLKGYSRTECTVEWSDNNTEELKHEWDSGVEEYGGVTSDGQVEKKGIELYTSMTNESLAVEYFNRIGSNPFEAGNNRTTVIRLLVAHDAETKQFEGHTPGPWTVMKFKTGAQIYSADNNVICHINPVSPSETPINAALIASAPDLLKERDNLNSDLAVARAALQARIIQVANLEYLNAELLEALKKIAESSEPSKADARGFQAIAKAAIAKAEGRKHGK